MNTKAASERYQRHLQELSKQPGNSTCADCGGRYPRWASWSLGIFLCVNCAGVHRKMGTHISKVKSLTLDTWSREQVEKMREIGNEKSNMRYNPDVRRNRPPTNVEEGERNSELERFIFDKYRGRFMDSKPPPVPVKDRPSVPPSNTGIPSVMVSDPADASRRRAPDALGLPAHSDLTRMRSSTAPITSSWEAAKRATSVSPSPVHTRNDVAPANTAATLPPTMPAAIPSRASSSGALALSSQPSNASPSGLTASVPSTSTVFNDLLSLQGPEHTAMQQQQPQLQMLQPNQQMNPWAHLAMQQQAVVSPMVMSHSPYFQQPQPQPQQHLTAPHSPYGAAGFVGNQQRSVSLGTMAFSPQPTAEMSSYFAGAAGTSPGYPAQMMGQQAFSQNGTIPAFQQQQQPQQHPQQQMFMQPQPTQPQQQPQQSNPFGAFATAMMPNGQQQQQQQQQQPSAVWPQQNAWG